MREVTISSLIGKSVSNAKKILFRPFLLRKWLTLLFIACMAGAMVASGGCGGGGGEDEDEEESVMTAQQQQTTGTNIPVTQVQGEDAGETVEAEEGEESDEDKAFSWTVIASVAGGVVFFMLALGYFFLWFQCRFRFIWFDSVVKNASAIREPFRRYRLEGNSLFKFFVVSSLLSLIMLGGVIAWAIMGGRAAGIFGDDYVWSILSFFQIFAAPLGVLVILFLAMGFVYLTIDDFVVPIMALDHSRFLAAWKKFVGVVRANVKDFVLYYFVRFGLAIARKILELILFFAALIALIIIALVVFGSMFFAMSFVIKTAWVTMAMAIFFAILFAIVLILILNGIGLPFAVFMRSFSLYYLSSLNCGYTPFPEPEKHAI